MSPTANVLFEHEEQAVMDRVEKAWLGRASIHFSNMAVVREEPDKRLMPRRFDQFVKLFRAGLLRRGDVGDNFTALISREQVSLIPSLTRSATNSDRSARLPVRTTAHPSTPESKLSLEILQGYHRYRAVEVALPKEQHWWYFDLYEDSLDQDAISYLRRSQHFSICEEPKDALLRLNDAINRKYDAGANRTFKLLDHGQRKSFKQLLDPECACGPAFLKLFDFPALFEKQRKLGQLKHMLPLTAHEELNQYLTLTYETWDVIKSFAGEITSSTVQLLQGLYPKYSAHDKGIVEDWAKTISLNEDARSAFLNAMLERPQITSIDTFFNDMKLIEICYSALKRLAPRCKRTDSGGARGPQIISLQQAYRSMFSPPHGEDFYRSWCELLMCCLRCRTRHGSQIRGSPAMEVDLDVDYLLDCAKALDFVVDRSGKSTGRQPLQPPVILSCQMTTDNADDGFSQNVEIARKRKGPGKGPGVFAKEELVNWRPRLTLSAVLEANDTSGRQWMTSTGVILASLSCFLDASRLSRMSLSEVKSWYRRLSIASVASPPAESLADSMRQRLWQNAPLLQQIQGRMSTLLHNESGEGQLDDYVTTILEHFPALREVRDCANVDDTAFNARSKEPLETDTIDEHYSTHSEAEEDSIRIRQRFSNVKHELLTAQGRLRRIEDEAMKLTVDNDALREQKLKLERGIAGLRGEEAKFEIAINTMHSNKTQLELDIRELEKDKAHLVDLNQSMRAKAVLGPSQSSAKPNGQRSADDRQKPGTAQAPLAQRRVTRRFQSKDDMTSMNHSVGETVARLRRSNSVGSQDMAPLGSPSIWSERLRSSMIPAKRNAPDDHFIGGSSSKMNNRWVKQTIRKRE